jgi:hypothetical protein
VTPTRGKTSSKKARRSKSILVFGESENDRGVIQELFYALCPDFEGTVRQIRKPQVLIRDCHVDRIPDRLKMIGSLIDAERVTNDVICIFAHEDCDAVEPAHLEVSHKIERAFSEAGYHIHAVTPAWETESWLFLWPDAIAEYRPSWRRVDKYAGKNVGMIQNAKEELGNAVKPSSRVQSYRAYRESDAPLIAQKVRELGLANSPRAKSASYDRFRENVSACCGNTAI